MSGTFNLADYATVDERIDKYWATHPKPEGSIQTEIIWVSDDGLSVAIKATVYMGERILATGIAQEERLTGEDKWGKPVKGANTSSWWENCETSAIGRALANMGMSLSKRASREEMQKVERYSQNRQPVERDPDDDLPEYVPAQRPAPPARPTPPAAQPVAPSAPQANRPPEGWTTVWTEAKAQGIKDRTALEQFMGVDPGAPLDTAVVLRQLRGQPAPPAPRPAG